MFSIATKAASSSAFTPISLFGSTGLGAWYDPSDVANLDWRVNLLTFTEQFDNTAWVKQNINPFGSGSVVNTTATTDPVGGNNADFIQESTANNIHWVEQQFTTSALTYTFSCYMKASTRNWGYLRIRLSGGADRAAFFNLFNGTIGTVQAGISADVTSVGNGWYRCEITTTTPIVGSNILVVGVTTADNTTVYTGDGTSGIFIWGAQLELGSTATAYQPITDVNAEVLQRFPNTTMFQDTAGTTPVTTTGQTVGLVLDKSKGLVLGPELVGTLTLGSGWVSNGNGSWSITNAASTSDFRLDFSAIAGKTMRVQYTISGTPLSSVIFVLNTSPGIVSTGSFSSLTVPNATFLIVRAATGASITISNISVKELPGNHATQATAASRPIYGIEPFGGRRNLLVRTEEFDNAYWVKSNTSIESNAIAAPDGTLTADKLIENTANAQHFILRQQGWTGTHTISFYAKAAERSRCMVIHNASFNGAIFDLLAGTVVSTTAGYSASIQSVGNGWYRCSVTTTSFGDTNHKVGVVIANDSNAISYAGDGTSGLYIWGAQLETGSVATAYQRVTDQWNVTQAGVASVSYLAFDGTDDFLVTPTITPGIDKAQIFAGVRKLSDVAVAASSAAVILESSPGRQSNSGTVFLTGSIGFNTGIRYGFESRGTTTAGANTTSTDYTAPITNVLTALGDIAGDRSTLRINGSQIVQTTTDQGTGNYLGYPLYIGRGGGGTQWPLNGRLYGLAVRFGANLSAAQISQMENWTAGKTGVYTLAQLNRISALTSAGTSYSAYAASDSSGNNYRVTATVLSSNGTSYQV